MTSLDVLLSLRPHGRGRHRAVERGALAEYLNRLRARRSWPRRIYYELRRAPSMATLVGFLLYVLLSSFLGGVMSLPVPGLGNVGVLLGLSQFIVFFAFAAHGLRTDCRGDPWSGELGEPVEPYR
ncbi:DUF485 domain-containing protein [Streptantibioticus rubrisoli]|uniref:DUF485 domain-containing protein n=1 Tax=Streptantibioticus rubrisoli TaxID=1387313 RepID=A0ABT1P5R4_9ACTN|nr:DUF485 domain-containing protein [Streptantibioticus rubrisoli]MCQ4040705.1 DUF485 domain-containing protein [Streptantibioticus rubrisoli]